MKIEIKDHLWVKPHLFELKINGKKIDKVRSFKYDCPLDGPPILTIEILAIGENELDLDIPPENIKVVKATP